VPAIGYDAPVPRVRSRLLRFTYWLVLLAAAMLLFVAVWILIPAPNEALLPFGVGAPELSPVLLAMALVLAAVASLFARTLGTARLALVLALVSTVLGCWPLVQLPSTLRRFDEAMAAAFGPPASVRQPVDLVKLFRPAAPAASRIIRGVQFAAPNGVPLTLDIYKPQTAVRAPILVQIYGGRWQNGSPADDEWFARYFAAHGYVVASIDYRHAPRWKWPAQIDDVRSAIQWITMHAGEFDGDPTRIILLGRSSGGQLAMTAAFQNPPPSIKGVVSFYGPVDLADGWRHPPEPDPVHVRDILEKYLGGTPDQVADRYREASPITYASRKLPPALLIYGKRDHIVEARFGEQVDRALKRSGSTSVLLEVPWSEHAFDVLPNGLGGQVSLYYVEQFLANVSRR
jgi:acetyl esterase/lipase